MYINILMVETTQKQIIQETPTITNTTTTTTVSTIISKIWYLDVCVVVAVVAVGVADDGDYKLNLRGIEIRNIGAFIKSCLNYHEIFIYMSILHIFTCSWNTLFSFFGTRVLK